MNLRPTTSELQQQSDEQLARQLQQGCGQSFEELDRRYRSRLLYLLSRRLPQVHDAEDVVQQTLVRVYCKISQYNPDRKLSPWIFTIALRLAAEHGRKKHPVPGPTGDEALRTLDLGEPPAERAERQEAHEQLWTLAGRVLKGEQWTALWLFYGEELSLAEVAQSLGRTKTGTSVLLCRARKSLEPHLSKMLAGEQAPSYAGEDAAECSEYQTDLLLESRT